MTATPGAEPVSGSALLRFATIGSVDDGKSTLIGRLLHDTKQLFDDQLEAVTSASRRRGTEGVDLSFVTDGLRAEREQGITIDVAYRYASTPRRKFVIADCPGHVQYTRNMATGASTADLALVVVDATAGLREQTRRHTCIAALLGVRHLLVAANKMDLADWSQAAYESTENQIDALALRLGMESVVIVPVSALLGDNVVEPSAHMPWYSGPTLLNALEEAPAGAWAGLGRRRCRRGAPARAMGGAPPRGWAELRGHGQRWDVSARGWGRRAPERTDEPAHVGRDLRRPSRRSIRIAVGDGPAR